MPTLVILASKRRERKGSESFETICANQLGKGYGIFSADVDQLRSDPESRVVLLRNDGIPKRSEGKRVELVWTGDEARAGVVRGRRPANTRRARAHPFYRAFGGSAALKIVSSMVSPYI